MITKLLITFFIISFTSLFAAKGLMDDNGDIKRNCEDVFTILGYVFTLSTICLIITGLVGVWVWL